MFSLTVRDHFMIAHSFNSETFGPAQRCHGATYVVDVTFKRPDLDRDDLVVDIAQANKALHEVLTEFNLHNLDEFEEFKGHNTTTEFMARVVFERLSKAVHKGRLGDTAKGVTAMCVTLHESHVAWASYEGAL